MAVKVFFISKTRSCKVENQSNSIDFYEADDGYHPYAHDSIYADREGKLPPIAIFYEGLVSAEGSNATKTYIDSKAAVADMIKMSGKAPTVSKRASRFLQSLIAAGKKYFAYIFVAVVLLYGILSAGGL